jgi:hypothetical protein
MRGEGGRKEKGKEKITTADPVMMGANELSPRGATKNATVIVTEADAAIGTETGTKDVTDLIDLIERGIAGRTEIVIAGRVAAAGAAVAVVVVAAAAAVAAAGRRRMNAVEESRAMLEVVCGGGARTLAGAHNSILLRVLSTADLLFLARQSMGSFLYWKTEPRATEQVATCVCGRGEAVAKVSNISISIARVTYTHTPKRLTPTSLFVSSAVATQLLTSSRCTFSFKFRWGALLHTNNFLLANSAKNSEFSDGFPFLGMLNPLEGCTDLSSKSALFLGTTQITPDRTVAGEQ